MPHYSVGYGVRRRDDEREAFMLVERTPWWVMIAQTAGEWACAITRHRTCMWVCGDVYEWAEKRRKTFETPCTPEHAAAFSQWRGWGRPFFMNEDGAQVPYADDYRRTP